MTVVDQGPKTGKKQLTFKGQTPSVGEKVPRLDSYPSIDDRLEYSALEREVLQSVSDRFRGLAEAMSGVAKADVQVLGSTKKPRLMASLWLDRQAAPESVMARISSELIPGLETVLGYLLEERRVQFNFADEHARTIHAGNTIDAAGIGGL